MSNRITRRSRIGLLGCALLLAAPATSLAQPVRVTRGDTVRLEQVYHVGKTPWLVHREGVFAGRLADTVWLDRGDDTVRVRLTDLTESRVQRGSHPWGAGKGIIIGLLASTLIQTVWVATDSYEAAGCQTAKSFFGLEVTGCDRELHSYHVEWFAAGMVAGGVLGYHWKRPTWLDGILP